MSEMNGWNSGDPFAPEAVEASIARFLQTDAPATPTTVLVRALDDAYALPAAADAVLARSRATLARRAEALGGGRRQTRGVRRLSTDSWPAPATFSTRPPQPPRRRVGPFATAMRTAAAVLVVALLGAGFYALLRGIARPGAHPTPTATPGVSTPTPIPPQPPAPAGVYVTAPEGLFRLDPHTGAIQQRSPLAAPSYMSAGTPIVANGIVYYTSYVSPQEFAVVAVSATSGTQLWHTPTATEVVQLALADGTLYGATASSTVTGSDMFYALRASDGRVLWTFPTANLRGSAITTGGVVYLANQPQNTVVQHVHALRAADGLPLWDTALPPASGVASGEAVDQGMVFVSCGVQFLNGQSGSDIVYGLRASDGSVLWHSSTTGHPGVAAAGAGLVYVVFGGKNAAGAIVNGAVALEETSGAVRWQQGADVIGWPVFDGTTMYAEVASSSTFTAPASGNLAAFSASDGHVRWTYPEANPRLEAEPLVASGVVYQGLDGQVVAISAAAGTLLWQSPTLDAQAGVFGLSVVT
jgi:outer membrane protein assembly factor BamB